MPALQGIAHVELTVRDLDASEAWYAKVLGLRRVWEGRDEAQQITARALLEPQSRVVLGLTQHLAQTGERFDVRRPGLDHLSFAVADRAELRAWEQRLAELGLDYTPAEEWSHGAGLTVRDPDGIAIEFYVLGAAKAQPAAGN
ncbi:MAG TPA: VOC family protein [Dehalococcoidia bacterium]|nr:VOC family protein [Dehalococcoidia bacterium]